MTRHAAIAPPDRIKILVIRRATVALIALVWCNLAFGGEIHDAAKNGDLAKVKALLNDPDLVSSADDNVRTPLHHAAMKDHKDVAESLLANKANPEKLFLWKNQAPVGDGKFEAANASITVHRPDPAKANGAAMVICPGGGYGGLVTGPEGHGIAKWLNQHGLAGIVLEYRLPRGRSFVPLLDAQRAIRTVRFNAKQWGIDPVRIGIIGFSAGGHLASTAGTHFDDGDPKATDPVNRLSCRPDFAILIYPVVTMGEKTHGGSKANLLGRNPKSEMMDMFSSEKQVTDRTPPMFLAHAKDDTLVSPENSRMLFEALKAHKLAAEYLELPSGGHGLNGYQGPMWVAWQTKLLEWLALQKMISHTDVAGSDGPGK